METGNKLGPYEIVEPLGAGGMGEVYLARDTRLGRDVAIKVLPSQFASNPERLARFVREAKAAAALNHPHIATVHDVGESDGVRYIVQEHLQGSTVRQAIEGGPLPANKALQLATEVAEALAAAHHAGIVHRDLKPENLFVTEAGHAKVLDFGLVKLIEPDVAGEEMPEVTGSPTVLGSVAGQVMGTAGYMSPEQVDGRDVDHRADLFAFGCVLYEIATGRSAFRGASVLDTLHGIVHDEAKPLSDVAPTLPADLQRILRKCLEKDPTRRYQSADDLVVDLRALVLDVEAGNAVPAGGMAVAGGGSRVATGLTGAAALLGIVLGGLAVWYAMRSPPPTPRPVQRYVIETEPIWRNNLALALSPDGGHLVYQTLGANRSPGLRHRPLGRLETIAWPGTAAWPVFSPDSRWVMFANPDGLFRTPIGGGEPFRLSESGGSATWGDDGTIVFADRERLMQLPWTGGEPQELLVATDPNEGRFGRPRFLPGSRALLFEHYAGEGVRVEVLDRASGQTRTVAQEGSNPRFSSSGHLLYARGSVIEAIPFDHVSLEALGPAVPVLHDVAVMGGGAALFALSDNGTLAYVPADSETGTSRTVVWVSRDGAESQIVDYPGRLETVRLSPDGRRIAAEIFVTPTDTVRADIWLYGLEDGTWVKLNDDVWGQSPVWTPDSRRVAFAVMGGEGGGFAAGGVAWKPADFSGDRELLYQRDDGQVFALSWSEQGELLMHQMVQGQQNRRILVLPVDGGSEPEARDLLDDSGRYNQRSPMISPDGRWLAYVEAQSGRDEIYVRPYPGPGGRYPISDQGGAEPMWGASSAELFYRTPDLRMVAVSLETEPELRITGRQDLFADVYVRHPVAARAVYDYDRRNNRFLMVRRPQTETNNVIIVVNWFEELRRQAPVER